jgi:hypothetical protein
MSDEGRAHPALVIVSSRDSDLRRFRLRLPKKHPGIVGLFGGSQLQAGDRITKSTVVQAHDADQMQGIKLSRFILEQSTAASLGLA